MEGFRYWRALRRWWWLVLGIGIVAGLVATAASFALPKTYGVSTSAVVNPFQPIIPPAVDKNGAIVGGTGTAPTTSEVVQTYATLFNARPVRQRLISQGIPRGDEQLARDITARARPGTTVVDISVLDQDPLVAERVAQQIVPAFNQSIEQLQAQVSADQRTHLSGIVSWEVPESPPALPISPDIRSNGLKGFGVGLLGGLILAFLLEYLDRTVKRAADVPLQLGWPLLAEIVLHPAGDSRNGKVPLAAVKDPRGPLAEEYRTLQTNLLFAPEGRKLRRLAITSAIPGEGKTSVACNLAVAIAEAGNHVVLIDGDFRRPAVHAAFDLPNEAGLSNLITSPEFDPALVHDSPMPRLKVITSGPAPANPAALLASQGMERLVAQLQAACDVVVFDSPPAGVSDAIVLAAAADGVIVVVESGRTPIPVVQKTRDSLARVQARVLGVVLNKVRRVDRGYYYNYYYAKNSHQPPSGNGHALAPSARFSMSADEPPAAGVSAGVGEPPPKTTPGKR